MEEGVAGSQRRTANLLQLKPDERYARFVASRPELARRVPQFLIASYLGITPEALSRIRRRRLQTPRSA
jgi:CRP-like cAMP-binding protein